MITCPRCGATDVQRHMQQYWSHPWIWCLRCETAHDLPTATWK